MLFKNIDILDENLNLKKNCFAGIRGHIIEYIGENRPSGEWGREYDGRGKLLMSGFYNAHAHSPMTLMRGYGENMALQDWLSKKIFPFEEQLTGEAVYWATMLAMAESFRFGIVSTSDMYYFCEEMAKAYEDSGAKGNIARSVANTEGKDPRKLRGFAEARDFYDNYNGAADGRIKVDMSLHAEYTSDEKTALALAEYAVKKGCLMQVHVSETRLEHEECIKRHGMTPAAYLEKNGIFDIPAVAAHCVYSTEDDLEIFRKKNVTVAVNPVSNMKLDSGICDVSKMFRRGVRVAVGTDSVASNNSLNFIEELKLMAVGGKIAADDPEAVTPAEVITAATLGGALAQGRTDCGTLKEGSRADIIVIDTSLPNMHPVHNIINNIVYSYSGSDIIMTVVDGKVVYENGSYPTIDLEKTVYNVGKAAAEILERL